MIQKIEEKYTGRLKDSLRQPLPERGSIALWWLGQAGFAVKSNNTMLFIDPYLSDALAKKYQGQEFPHIRLMASPILAEEVTKLDFLLCTHRHTDHTDPEALPIIAQQNNACLLPPEPKRNGLRNRGRQAWMFSECRRMRQPGSGNQA